MTLPIVNDSSRPAQPLLLTLEDKKPYVKLALKLPVPPLERNPHDVPLFDDDTLNHPHSPILYLPPLLSSLPRHISEERTLFLIPPPERLPFVTETRLPDIDPVSLSLHKALHHLKPAAPNYAMLPYNEAFNWSELVLPLEEDREWYCVVFRSKRKKGSDSAALYKADRLAHEEAVGNGGLILYWYGVPDLSNGLNLATCIWQSRKHATAASSRPHHINSTRLAAASYDIYTLERHILRKEKGRSDLIVYPYISGDVGW